MVRDRVVSVRLSDGKAADDAPPAIADLTLTDNLPWEFSQFTQALALGNADLDVEKVAADLQGEARARFLYEYGVRETESDGSGIIVTDLATTYRAEAHARDLLVFEVGVMDFNKYGGDITFHGFKEGVVFLNMKGSCAGCPSSTATLKHGIESRLRAAVPEVRQVEAV